MDGGRTQWRLKQRYGNQTDTLDPHYDVVNDQEEFHNVLIQPARPIDDEREYADRDLPRSSSAQSLSSDPAAGHSKVHPTYPPRKITIKPAPTINRDMKPGRRKKSSANSHSRQSKDPVKHTHRSFAHSVFITLLITFLSGPITAITQVITPPSPTSHQLNESWPFCTCNRIMASSRCPPSPLFPVELVEQLSAMTLPESTKRQRQKPAKKVSSQTQKNTNSFVHKNIPGSHVETATFSLDIKAKHIAERWLNEELDLGEKEDAKLQHYHHEWPQMENACGQHPFVSMEKTQIHREDDWYIGLCSRTDAEHALHLFNRDGAFLVRDCSLKSNSEPFVLSVYYEKKVYNVKIRYMESLRKYALGTGQRSTEMFDSVSDIVKFHSIFPIVLISAKNVLGSRGPEKCVLTYSLTKEDADRLLQ
ncbi:uncharacterized protein [Eucyclogobius newberryi]|uniref:uncharacterized protein n=1 Tax=Eucyclogobius newberryi TaxID=166745 RepID=UPI003B5C80C3